MKDKSKTNKTVTQTGNEEKHKMKLMAKSFDTNQIYDFN